MGNNIELNVNDFWERLKQISASRNVTQVELCEKTNIDVRQLRNKKNLGTYPNMEQLVKISRFFGVSLNYMITGETADESETELLAELERYKAKIEQLKEIINDPVSSLPSNA